MFMFFEELRDGSWLNGWGPLSFLFRDLSILLYETEKLLKEKEILYELKFEL